MKSAAHANLSIFVPHAGCPNSCSFCDQRAITGAVHAPTAQQVRELCDKYLPQAQGENGLNTAGQAAKHETAENTAGLNTAEQSIAASRAAQTEIAFFGGSFTAIEHSYMTELLATAHEFVAAGRAQGIRCSTRPDAIDEATLRTLKKYGVTTIELGAQSMLDDVLLKNSRGHTAAQVEAAAQLIKAGGFALGLQMMVGLHGEGDAQAAAQYTAARIAALKPDCVRIYPAITLQNTALARLYSSGAYKPLGLDEAVQICAGLLLFFEQQGIPVIKLGLHADEQLEKNIVAGPYHRAFRQLCENEIAYNAVKNELDEMLQSGAQGEMRQNSKLSEILQNGAQGCVEAAVYVQSRELSNFIGHGGKNVKRLAAGGYNVRFLPDDTLRGSRAFKIIFN